MMRAPILMVTLCASMLLGACEKAQTAGAAKSAAGKPWESRHEGFDASGYKPGDRDAWEAQLRARNVGQNEYAKTR